MSIKEIWGKLRYWQRGGVVGGIVGVIIFYSFGGDGEFPPPGLSDIELVITSVIISPLVFPLGAFANSDFIIDKNIYLIGFISSIFAVLPYFMIGSSFGQLYGSIKSRTIKPIPFIIPLLILIGYALLAILFSLALLLGD